jgi:hypothetical protein
MDDNSSNETKDGEDLWSDRRAASSLTSSEHDMSDQRKNLIRQVLAFDIVDIRSYTGYKGDLLVEITTMKPDVVRSLKKVAEALEFEIVIQKDIISLYKIFCISPTFNIYDLK